MFSTGIACALPTYVVEFCVSGDYCVASQDASQMAVGTAWWRYEYSTSYGCIGFLDYALCCCCRESGATDSDCCDGRYDSETVRLSLVLLRDFRMTAVWRLIQSPSHSWAHAGPSLDIESQCRYYHRIPFSSGTTQVHDEVPRTAPSRLPEKDVPLFANRSPWITRLRCNRGRDRRCHPGHVAPSDSVELSWRQLRHRRVSSFWARWLCSSRRPKSRRVGELSAEMEKDVFAALLCYAH